MTVPLSLADATTANSPCIEIVPVLLPAAEVTERWSGLRSTPGPSSEMTELGSKRCSIPLWAGAGDDIISWAELAVSLVVTGVTSTVPPCIEIMLLGADTGDAKAAVAWLASSADVTAVLPAIGMLPLVADGCGRRGEWAKPIVTGVTSTVPPCIEIMLLGADTGDTKAAVAWLTSSADLTAALPAIGMLPLVADGCGGRGDWATPTASP